MAVYAYITYMYALAAQLGNTLQHTKNIRHKRHTSQAFSSIFLFRRYVAI